MGGLGRQKARPRGVAVVPVASVRDGLCAETLSAEGAINRKALRTLRERGLAPSSIVAVQPYAIAWRDRTGAVRSTFTEVEALPGVDLFEVDSVVGRFRVRFVTVDGLPAFPE